MITLYAQPYDISAEGFYFRDTEEYKKRVAMVTNQCGEPVEEFEIQFIDGEGIDCELAKAIGLNQANYSTFLTWVEDWENWQKIHFIIAVGECGYSYDEETDPDEFHVDLYEEENLKELAYRFVDEGLFGEIPENIQCYLDYDAIARDLGCDYSETVIAGQSLIYRCD